VDAQYDAELTEARAYYEQVREAYLSILGPTPCSEVGEASCHCDGRTKAVMEWHFTTATVQLSLASDDGGEWPLDEVRLRLIPPGSPAQWWPPSLP